MKILSVDLGKFKSVFYVHQDGAARFVTVPTCRDSFRQLIEKTARYVVVFETCTVAGWVRPRVRGGHHRFSELL